MRRCFFILNSKIGCIVPKINNLTKLTFNVSFV